MKKKTVAAKAATNKEISMTLELPSGDFSPKKWFERPEKWVSLGALGVGAFALYIKLLPWLLTIVWGTVQLLVGGLVIAFIIALFAHPQSRFAVAYLFDRLMFALTNAIITIDPIGVMKKVIAYLKQLKAEIDEQDANLLGQEKTLKNAIKEDTAEARQALMLAAMAERQQKRGQVVTEAGKAHRRQQSIKNYRELLDLTVGHRTDLQKYGEMADAIIQDKEDYVKHREKERRIIYGVFNAVRAAARILKGSGTHLEMYTRADEYLVQDLSRKVGVIEQFKLASAGAINSYDLEKSVVDEEALELFERYKRDGMAILEAGPTPQLLEALNSGETVEGQVVRREGEKVPAGKNDQIKNLFNR